MRDPQTWRDLVADVASLRKETETAQFTIKKLWAHIIGLWLALFIGGLLHLLVAVHT